VGANVPTAGTWREVPALAAPVQVSAQAAPPQLRGETVRAAAFVSATTGWVVVSGRGSPMLCLLRTEDAGVTWTPRLAWPGNIFGALWGFDAQRAGLVIGLGSRLSYEINGKTVMVGQPFHYFVACTQDGGTTWTLGSPPDRQGSSTYFLTPQQIWLLIHVSGSELGRPDLARTSDGGATWSRIERKDELAVTNVAFSSSTDGLLIAADLRRADILYRTTDAGLTWTRQHLTPPPGIPKRAETWLFPVVTPEVGNLLTLRAVSRRESATRPAWEGTYAYARDGDGWTGPHRLPTAPASTGHDLLVPDPDGRLWCASVHDVWVGDNLDGPWQPAPWHAFAQHPLEPGYVRLPGEEVISGIWPVGDGVLWLTSTLGVSGGSLYRSDDNGAHWVRLSIA
jgi:hypothetical protein